MESLIRGLVGLAWMSFNSLQTGNLMERKITSTEHFRHLSFNSLQTGNLMESYITPYAVTSICEVSIPFKRETSWKAKPPQRHIRYKKVSIPFKRETSWKVYQYIAKEMEVCCFNSLQTGNLMESVFFSSHGSQIRNVSIPFKRETSWKGNMFFQ